MNRTLIALFFISSPPVLTDHGFYVNLNSAFHPADAENSSTVDSFWETGVGFGYKEQVSDAWNAHYQMGVTTAKPEYSGVGDARTQGVYSRVLFEFNQLSDTVKPFAGVGLQQLSHQLITALMLKSLLASIFTLNQKTTLSM